MPVHFDNPPINEVVIATHFDPPLTALRNEHIGLFWREVRGDFPYVQQRRPTTPPVPPTRDTEDAEIFPMPRYWFVAGDDINLLQVQKDALMLNWRRRGAAYPGYTRIKPAFDRYYTVLGDFVAAEFGTGLGIDSCELAYVNVLEQSDFWSVPSDTGRVITSFWAPDAGLHSHDYPDFNCRFGYQVAGDLRIDIAIRSGVAVQQPDTLLLIFEIKATGRPGSQTKSRADVWFDRAHDAVSTCFLRLTTPEAHRLWGIKEA